MFILVSFFFTFLKPLFYLSCFIFHYNGLNIRRLERWNIVLQCFIFSFMFHFSKHNGSDCALPLCFCFAPSVFWNRSHSVFVFLPLCFYFFIGQYKDETLKLKMKHSLVMFHSYNTLITNAFSTENETWNKNYQG